MIYHSISLLIFLSWLLTTSILKAIYYFLNLRTGQIINIWEAMGKGPPQLPPPRDSLYYGHLSCFTGFQSSPVSLVCVGSSCPSTLKTLTFWNPNFCKDPFKFHFVHTEYLTVIRPPGPSPSPPFPHFFLGFHVLLGIFTELSAFCLMLQYSVVSLGTGPRLSQSYQPTAPSTNSTQWEVIKAAFSENYECNCWQDGQTFHAWGEGCLL